MVDYYVYYGSGDYRRNSGGKVRLVGEWGPVKGPFYSSLKGVVKMNSVVKMLEQKRGAYKKLMDNGIHSSIVHIPSVIADIDKAIKLLTSASSSRPGRV
jgi:hypothetical protein